jgi:hypothetical protein
MNRANPAMFHIEIRFILCGLMTSLHMAPTNPSYPSLPLTINPRKKTVSAGKPKKRMSFFMVFRTIQSLEGSPCVAIVSNHLFIDLWGTEDNVCSALA